MQLHVFGVTVFLAGSRVESPVVQADTTNHPPTPTQLISTSTSGKSSPREKEPLPATSHIPQLTIPTTAPTSPNVTTPSSQNSARAPPPIPDKPRVFWVIAQSRVSNCELPLGITRIRKEEYNARSSAFCCKCRSYVSKHRKSTRSISSDCSSERKPAKS